MTTFAWASARECPLGENRLSQMRTAGDVIMVLAVVAICWVSYVAGYAINDRPLREKLAACGRERAEADFALPEARKRFMRVLKPGGTVSENE